MSIDGGGDVRNKSGDLIVKITMEMRENKNVDLMSLMVVRISYLLLVLSSCYIVGVLKFYHHFEWKSK